MEDQGINAIVLVICTGNTKIAHSVKRLAEQRLSVNACNPRVYLTSHFSDGKSDGHISDGKVTVIYSMEKVMCWLLDLQNCG